MDEWHFVRSVGATLEDVVQQVEQDTYTLSEWLQTTINELEISRGEVIRRSELNPTYGYQIIQGQKHATRNKLLQLAFGMGLGIDKTNELLERGGANRLCAHDWRDVVIAYCRERDMTVGACDEALVRFDLEPLRAGYPNVQSWHVWPRAGAGAGAGAANFGCGRV